MNTAWDGKLWIGIVIGMLFLGCNQRQPNSGKPNILWITSEDNSPLLGAYGDSLADTPNLDHLAERGVVYENAFATTPVCAPSRFTLITGLYANVMGTENMRSSFPIPDKIKFFPKYLQEAGYYTTNNVKKDYNTVDQPEAWDESSDSAHYAGRADGQPFFHVRNFTITHESRLHDPIDTLIHDPDAMNIPPYHPKTPEIKTDWAHYYDQITKLDTKIGKVLDELKESGETKNTIIFYYSDHGGVLPRSKRFMFESGLHVPLMVYFPPKYEHLAPNTKRTDRLVSFVDFPATALSLAGIKPPDYMHGKPFLGEYADGPRKYIHSYRGRMDERIDLVRAVRNKEYLYVRNFMPHRIYGQHLAYLWRAPSMQSWQEEFEKGNLNEIQRRFFETKPAEELYKISSDPYNIDNLADDPQYQDVLKRMRQENISWMKERNDLGVIPEETINSIRQDRALYDAARADDMPIDDIIDVADQASRANAKNLDNLAQKLNHPNEAIRFWAVTAFSVADPEPQQYEEVLLKHIGDSSATVRIAIAEALFKYGETQRALSILSEALNSENTFVKLRALNTIQALRIATLPDFLAEQIKKIEQAHDEQWGTDYYIRRASRSILDEK